LTLDQIPNLMTNTNWDNATADWSANGYRLPTRMEWIWAAMGAPADGQNGSTNRTGYAKPFAGSDGSNFIADYAVFGYGRGETGATTNERTNPVGSKLPNEIGLYDMSGNVSENCWDWFGTTILSGTLTDYRGENPGLYFAVMNAGFQSLSANAVVGYSIGCGAIESSAQRGFRIAQKE
jgi:formylglycine-generating enzyme required for sulfatase activity